MSIEQYVPTPVYEAADRARRIGYDLLDRRRFGASLALEDDKGKLMVLTTQYGDTSRLMLPGGGLSILDQMRERRNPNVGQPQEYERYERTAWKELGEEAGIDRSVVEERGLLVESYDEEGEGRDLQVVYHGLIKATFIPQSLHVPSNEIRTREFLRLDDIDLNNSHHALAAAVTELKNRPS